MQIQYLYHLGIILVMVPANEGRLCNITSSRIGRAHNHINPCDPISEDLYIFFYDYQNANDTVDGTFV